MARVATRKSGSHGATVTATTATTTTTPRKQRPPVSFAGDDSPLQTPSRHRTIGPESAYDSVYDVPADDDAANGPGQGDVAAADVAVTPKRKRGRPPKARPAVASAPVDDNVAATPTGKRRRTDAFSTPVRAAVNGLNGAMDTPTRRTLADRSARRKSTRALIDRMVAADEDEDADEDALGDAILDEDDEDEDEEEADEEEDTREEEHGGAENEADNSRQRDVDAVPVAADEEPAPVVATPRKRGRPPKKKAPEDAQATDGPPPPKRRPGRPRKDPNAVVREPSPPRELPAHEQYFFQHRAGAATKTSNSTLAALRLLTHDEYFRLLAEQGTEADDEPAQPEAPLPRHRRHDRGIRALETLHAQSFAQWAFELSQGFGVCLYGYGSKQRLLHAFAAALYRGIRDHDAHRIVMVDGATGGGSASVSASAATLRDILLVVAAAATTNPQDDPPRLPQGTAAAERALLALLDGGRATTAAAAAEAAATAPIVTLVLNGIDAPALRRPAAQATLARLAGHRRIRLLCAADTPNFPLLWDGAARSQLNLVFHDATTFRPLWGDVVTAAAGTAAPGAAPAASAAHLDPVDEVHALLGRRARRVGGKDGAAFVLRSLPENARALFQLLVGEVLAAVGEGGGGGGGSGGGRRGVGRRRRADRDDAYDDDDDEDDEDDDGDDDDDGGYGDSGGGAPEAIGLEYRMLYNKAVEEFICSSEMSFRTLLKEFHDHQMVTSRKDAFGTELLSLPFRRDELEALLEDLAS